MNLTLMRESASLGNSFKDKAVLAFFGFMAPSEQRSQKKWWRLLAMGIPKIWLKPRQLSGLQIFINPCDWSQTCIFEEVFLRNGYDLARLGFVPEMILDCGGHIGTFSLLAKARFPQAQLTIYEPNPENIQMLRRQIGRNNLGARLMECAVSIETKEMVFAAGNSHSGRLMLETGSGGYRVKVIDLPSAFKEMKLQSLLLKMDIEGEELRVLPVLAPLLPERCAIFFETHGGLPAWEQVQKLLQDARFRVEKVNERDRFIDGFACRGQP
jgi:FkbM family methyltransferase